MDLQKDNPSVTAFNQMAQEAEKLQAQRFSPRKEKAAEMKTEVKDEKPKYELKPCPFCGSKCTVENVCTNEDQTSKYVSCSNQTCMYSSASGKDESEAVRKHNELCLKASGNMDAIPSENKVYGKYRILDALTDEPKEGKYFVLKVDAKSTKESEIVKATLRHYAELQRGAGNSAFADSIEDYIKE